MVIIVTAIQLRIQYRNINTLRLKEPKEIKELQREIAVWKRAAESIALIKDAHLVRESLNEKVRVLNHKLRKLEISVPLQSYKCTLEELTTNVGVSDLYRHHTKITVSK